MRRSPWSLLLVIGLSLVAPRLWAQDDDEVIEDSTLSKVQYDAEGNPIGGDPSKRGKRYCTYKVQGQSPNKLITLGYELQGSFSLTGAGVPEPNAVMQPSYAFTSDVRLKQGMRLGLNVPIISNYKGALNLGLGFQDFQWIFDRVGVVQGSTASLPIQGSATDVEMPAHKSLRTVGMRTVNLNLTWFKPLNERHFLLFYAEGALNGNWGLDDLGPLSLVRPTYFGLFGWKRNERSALAVGAAYTWRIGEANIIPLVYWFHTFNAKWGIEALAPARILVRRTLNPRTLLLAGYELEGGSFTLRNVPGYIAGAIPQGLNSRTVELRQSELKLRLQLEREIHNFWWFSVQAGWRVNFNHNVSASVVSPRGEYLFEQRQTGTWYVAANVHLVSF